MGELYLTLLKEIVDIARFKNWNETSLFRAERLDSLLAESNN